ncbi:MAG: serine/threonine protein kinase [Myxococcales bacterium]|nr:serine/threonine protein kinase [Myxococcales bacterium]
MGGDFAAGVVIADRYRLDHLLGEGGMGSVWAASHLLTRSTVALKFLKPEATKNAAAVRRFMREARAATSVNHPNVIRIHDIFLLADGAPVMVMDLLSGESLGQKLEREKKIALPALAAIMLPVVSAVGSAHAAGIVHRDLKPDNIFLARTPDGRVSPKVLDFGIAKLNRNTPDAAESANLTRTGALLGTPYYMSPEQVFGEKEIDARADVWSVGVILYESLTGVRPVDGDNLGQLFKVIATGTIRPIDEVAPDLPLAVRSLIQEMLRTDRSRRCSSLEPAFEVLRRFTNEMAQSFSGVLVPGSELPLTSETAASPGVSALTPRSLDSSPGDVALGAHPPTSSAFSTTGPGHTIVTPTHRPPVLAIAAGAAVLVAVAGVALYPKERSTSAAAETQPAPSAAEAPAAISSAASPEVPSTSSADPPPSDAGAASVAPERARPAVAAARTAAPLPAKPAPSAQPAAPPPSAKPAAPATALGGVAVEAPF